MITEGSHRGIYKQGILQKTGHTFVTVNNWPEAVKLLPGSNFSLSNPSPKLTPPTDHLALNTAHTLSSTERLRGRATLSLEEALLRAGPLARVEMAIKLVQGVSMVEGVLGPCKINDFE